MGGPVAIYLDTNVLYGWRTLAEAERLVVDILAAELGLEIVIPSLVTDELEEHWRRELQSAADTFYAAATKVEELFDLEPIWTEPALDLDRVLDGRRRALGEAFRSCVGAPEDAVEGLRREIKGEPPAIRERGQPGRGARDVAIWMSVVRDHLHRQEPGHFITTDNGFWAGDKPHPGLRKDLAGAAERMYMHRSPTNFVEQLGRRVETEVELKDVQTALPIVSAGLEHLQALPRAVFDLDGSDPEEFDFRTRITDGAVQAIERAWRFVGSGHEVLLVDASWQLEFALLFRKRRTDQPVGWTAVDALSARGRVQMYLTDPGQEATAGQFIAAQLKPDQYLWLQGDQVISLSRTQDPEDAF
jgi:hypothetical protein